MSGPQRLIIAAALLVVVWVATYWLWPAPSDRVGDAPTTFDPPAATERPVSNQQPRNAGRAPAGRGGGSGATIPGATTTSSTSLPEPMNLLPLGPDPRASTTTPALPEGQTAHTPDAPTGAEPRGGVIPPRFTEHVVARDEDLMRISERFYGRRDLWQAIAKANPFVDPNRLKTGQRIRIPIDPENIQGLAFGPGAETPPKPKPRPEPEVIYTVVSGDNLSTIARTYYGKSASWEIIYNANRKILNSPDDLRVGMKLRIPPAPAEKQASVPD